MLLIIPVRIDIRKTGVKMCNFRYGYSITFVSKHQLCFKVSDLNKFVNILLSQNYLFFREQNWHPNVNVPLWHLDVLVHLAVPMLATHSSWTRRGDLICSGTNQCCTVWERYSGIQLSVHGNRSFHRQIGFLYITNILLC